MDVNTTNIVPIDPSTTDDITSISSGGTSPGSPPSGSSPSSETGTSGTYSVSSERGTTHTSTSSSSSTTTRTSTTTEYYPPLPPAPPPPPYNPNYPWDKNRKTISSEAATNTALVIGIIAGTMIAIILIILIVLKLKNRSGVVYKVDERKGYSVSSCQGQNAALLNQSPPTPQAINGQVKNGNGKTKKRETKDIKEWYV